jgi:integrase
VSGSGDAGSLPGDAGSLPGDAGSLPGDAGSLPGDSSAAHDHSALAMTVRTTTSAGEDGPAWETDSSADLPGGWRFESQRWLATLNPGRTQREYQKAISYFFITAGVPQEISGLTFDLLLAYRGALALRATAHAETQPRRTARSGPRATITGGNSAELDREKSGEAFDQPSSTSSSISSPPGPLSPATVNVRLTALRQFLVYCALYGSATTLSADRIRAALRRLSVERRRPYQTLAEPEWELFLAMALLPSQRVKQSEPTILQSQSTRLPGPWGITRAARDEAQRQLSERGEAQRQLSERGEGEEPERFDTRDVEADIASGAQKPIRSRAGLTGERTARRDYALLALALATGLRAIELASLDVGDLSREWRAGAEEWWLILPDSKTKGQSGGRTLPLAPELAQIVRDYLEVTGRQWERPEDRETPLFLSGASRNIRSRLSATQRQTDEGAVPPPLAMRRLSPGQIRLIVDRVETQWQARYLGAGRKGARRSGDVRRISPHALRHSTAVALLEGNQATGRPPASVEHVRGWLGHLDIRTTQGYLAHLDARRHRRPFMLSPVSTGQVSTGQVSTGPRDDAEDT